MRGTAIVLSPIVWLELWSGALRSSRPEANIADLRQLVATFEVLAFDTADVEAAASLRFELARQGLPIGPYDVLIAAQALARDLTLVTGNVREFQRLAGLRLENWLE
jgi:tRNA(fMet)-specific endonuclease VapC